MGFFDGLLGLLSHDVGIDLGTANTLVTVRNRGIVISEPSVVAMDTRTKRVLAIGAEAKRMVGRTPARGARRDDQRRRALGPPHRGADGRGDRRRPPGQ